VAALPLLAGIALGKLAMALGGAGQGLPSDVPWATAYAGPGPWASLAPLIASHPAQLYEAGVALVAFIVLSAVVVAGGFGQRDGRLFLVVVAVWALGRAVVAFAWRDAEVLGPLRADQLISLAVVAAIAGRLAWQARRGRSHEPSWPDPETRPEF
jgi:prolipoprotein diacylglyceryltransferase